MAGSTEYKNKWAAENLDQLRVQCLREKKVSWTLMQKSMVIRAMRII